jgi:hypothetical protein
MSDPLTLEDLNVLERGSSTERLSGAALTNPRRG